MPILVAFVCCVSNCKEANPPSLVHLVEPSAGDKNFTETKQPLSSFLEIPCTRD
jgi:hypothetical protein